MAHSSSQYFNFIHLQNEFISRDLDKTLYMKEIGSYDLNLFYYAYYFYGYMAALVESIFRFSVSAVECLIFVGQYLCSKISLVFRYE